MQSISASDNGLARFDAHAGDRCVYRNVEDDSLAMATHTAATGATDRGLRIFEPAGSDGSLG